MAAAWVRWTCWWIQPFLVNSVGSGCINSGALAAHSLAHSVIVLMLVVATASRHGFFQDPAKIAGHWPKLPIVFLLVLDLGFAG